MTYEQYWYGETRLLKVYYQAHKLRQNDVNREAWLNGVYVYKAIASVASALSSKNKSDYEPYPSEPIELFRQEKSAEQIEEQKERERVLAKAWMESLVQIGRAWNRGEQTAQAVGDK